MSFSPSAPRPAGGNPAEQQAVAAYYQGNVEESIREFEQLLQAEPENPRIKWELARSYSETGRSALAAEMLERIRPRPPDMDKDLFTALCLAGNYEKALLLLPLSQENPDTLFYEALLRRDRGEPEKAARLLRQSLDAQNFRPIGWLALGELYAAADPSGAETCFKTALRQDPEMRTALFPLGAALLRQRKYQEAYAYLNRAHRYFPWNSLIKRSLDEAAGMLPQVEDRGTPPPRRLLSAAPPTVRSLRQQDLVMVRIALMEGQSMATVKTGGAYTLRSGGVPGIEREQERAGGGSEQLWISRRDNRLLIQNQQEQTLMESAAPVALAYPNPDNTTIVGGSDGEDRSYRGSIEFRIADNRVSVINILNIEEYLYGVIPAEMPASWPQEALKAQAIAARSYTLAYRGQYRERGFDLYGTVLSAAYRGVTGEAAAATAAVDATRGMYLTAGGKPFKAYYSANHGGYSENTVSVWGDDTFNAAVPDKLAPPRLSALSLDRLTRWIRERPESYSSMPNLHSPQAYRWEKWVSVEELRSRNAEYGSIGDILAVVSRGRGISGRIHEVEMRGSLGVMRIKGDRIRSRLGGLRSNLFTVQAKLGRNGVPEYFIFQGAGWGHGVGLDQSGAAGMAQAGFSASQILAHYYPLAEPASANAPPW
ncbi:MAG: SpoIID/LytB domain-containing protein [Spirochaetaceae bacterium]|jgi:SpoIID/LytB domain protein|nr:SpoIID/LytB domain-containing protein [Spirochaetaceae bacterium]